MKTLHHPQHLHRGLTATALGTHHDDRRKFYKPRTARLSMREGGGSGGQVVAQPDASTKVGTLAKNLGVARAKLSSFLKNSSILACVSRPLPMDRLILQSSADRIEQAVHIHEEQWTVVHRQGMNPMPVHRSGSFNFPVSETALFDERVEVTAFGICGHQAIVARLWQVKILVDAAVAELDFER